MSRRRRVRNRGSVEKLSDGRYRARIRGKCLNGQPYDESAIRDNEVEAHRALEGLRRLAHDYETGHARPEEHTTLARYQERAKRQGLPWRRGDNSTWKYLRPLWNLPLHALDGARLQGWCGWLRKEGYAEATVRSATIMLKRVVNHAVAARVIDRKPWGDAPLALVKERDCGRREEVSDADWALVRDAAHALDAEGKGGPLADLWLRLSFQLIASVRPVEACQLGPQFIEPSPHGAVINVPKGIIAKGGKPDKRRTLGVELGDLLAHHFAALPESARVLGVYFPIRRKNGRWSFRFVVDAKGYKIGRDWITTTELGRLRERSGVLDFDPYQLRHRRLTAHAQRSPTLAQHQGGHASGRTTEHYTHTRTKHLTEESFSDISAELGLEVEGGGGPEGSGGGGKKKRGRFMVHEGAALPSERSSAEGGDYGGGEKASSDLNKGEGVNALRAQNVPSSAGRAVAWEHAECDAAEGYVDAVRAHGIDHVIAHVVRTLGPAGAASEARMLALFSLHPEQCSDALRPALQRLAGRLHESAIIAGAAVCAPTDFRRPTKRASEEVPKPNDIAEVASVGDLGFT